MRTPVLVTMGLWLDPMSDARWAPIEFCPPERWAAVLRTASVAWPPRRSLGAQRNLQQIRIARRRADEDVEVARPRAATIQGFDIEFSLPIGASTA